MSKEIIGALCQEILENGSEEQILELVNSLTAGIATYLRYSAGGSTVVFSESSSEYVAALDKYLTSINVDTTMH